MPKEETPLQELLSICKPTEYKDFVFLLITQLINSGYVAELQGKENRDEFTVKIQGLYNYFARLEHSHKES